MEMPIAFRILRLDAARGDGAKNWRPTFHLSMAARNQRNPHTDRLAWERLLNYSCVIDQWPKMRFLNRLKTMGVNAKSSNRNTPASTNTPKLSRPGQHQFLSFRYLLLIGQSLLLI
jgi:hypothetical protein